MKIIEIKPSTVRMLLPSLKHLFPNGLGPLVPALVRKARLDALQSDASGVPRLESQPQLPPVIVARMAKGGVGKTTVIGNLASALAMMGHKILLVDGDPQASLTGLMGVDWMKEDLVHVGSLMRRVHQRQPVELEGAIEPIYQDGHLDLIPADITLADADSWMIGAVNREQLFVRLLFENAEFFSRYDCILVDTAPATSLLTNALMLATSEVVAVTLLDGLSVKAMQVLASNIGEFNAAFRNLNMGMYIVVNGWHGSYKSCHASLEALTKHYPGQICETVLPYSAAFKRQVNPLEESETGTVMEKEPQSESALAIAELARTLAVRHGVGLGCVAVPGASIFGG